MRNKYLCSLAGAALLLSSGAALAQTTTTPAPSPVKPPAAATTNGSAKLTLTDAQAKSWVDKPVYSSDNKKIGEIAEFKRGTDNVVQEMHADIGGFLGMGETRVKLTPEQFKLQSDRAILNMTQAQAKDLPKVKS